MNLIRFIEDQAPDTPMEVDVLVNNDVSPNKLSYAVMVLKETADEAFSNSITSNIYGIETPFIRPDNWNDSGWCLKLKIVLDYFKEHLGFDYMFPEVTTQYVN